MRVFVKAPAARVDYMIDWSAGHLGRDIQNSKWTVSPNHDDSIAIKDRYEGQQSAASITGGMVGMVYNIKNEIILDDGAQLDRSICFRVEDNRC